VTGPLRARDWEIGSGRKGWNGSESTEGLAGEGYPLMKG
jgi:hypothetical protein